MWTERIARARHLASRHAYGREVLGFYAELAAVQSALAAAAASPDRGGEDFADAVDFERAAAAVPAFLEWLGRHGPTQLADAVPPATHLSRAHWHDRMRRRVAGEALDPSADDPLPAFVVEAVLQPFAEAAALPFRARLHAGHSARASTCPVCGSLPSVAALREEGQGARRTLVCSLCLTEWDYLRVVCPSCSEERFDALPVYTSETLPHARLDACDSCRTYLKTVDLTKDGHAIPCVDDLASLPLDLWAREQGYHRLGPNLLRL